MIAHSFNDSLHCPSSPRTKMMDQVCLDVPVHFHEGCELLYFEEGFGTRVIGDHTGEFTAGDMVLVGPNLPHTWHTNTIPPPSRPRIKSYVVHFLPEFLEGLAVPAEERQPVTDLLSRASRGVYFYGRTRDEAARKMKRMASAEGLKKIILFLGIIDILSRSEEYRVIASPRAVPERQDADRQGDDRHGTYRQGTERFSKTYRYILERYRTGFTLENVAAVAGMTPKAFCRYFKRMTGKTLTRFTNELRVEYACSRLNVPGCSVSDVCFDSGFNNLTHFNTSFRRHTGMTPSGYRVSASKVTGSAHARP